MTGPPTTARTTRIVAATIAGSFLVTAAHLAGFVAAREVLDRQAYVSELRLQSAMGTFRPVERAGLAKPVDSALFAADRNPRTDPADCLALTTLSSITPLDGQTWTGVNGRPVQPVNLLAVRYADADEARTQLDRKRLAMLRCTDVAITFPPYDAPATEYHVTGRRWLSSAVGNRVRWSLVGGGRRFDFYVRRYANVVAWTYADDVSTPATREQVADSLVERLQDLSRR